MALLAVDRLDVRFATPDGEVHAVKDLSFSIEPGETLGVVGESGSGKSQAVLAVLGLLATNGRASGTALFDGRDLMQMSARDLRGVRGRRIAMVFQDPMTSLNPYVTIEAQMMAVVRTHERVSRAAARARCLEMLAAVAIPDAATRLRRYPHELSGGMRQRVMIATSMLLHPELIVADEPTTALDVTVQAQILALLSELKARFGTALILITHDLGVVAGMADRILVMQSGEAREQGEARDVFYRPQHVYTRTLLAAVPRLDTVSADPAGVDSAGREPLVAVSDLTVHFPVAGDGWFAPKRALHALDGVDLKLAPGETLGVVGESGSGKSTLARAILNLVPPTAGRVAVLGRAYEQLSPDAMRGIRRQMQVVFQDPLASLNPRMTVGDIVSEPLWTHRPNMTPDEVRKAVAAVLERVGLTGRELNRYPHEFSGGQCQRIGIARALVLAPKVIICDEPVSALDVSIQAQIVNLLLELRTELDIALLFIAHDLAVVRRISHRIMVLYLGRVMEVASSDELCSAPRHPYTRALINAVPLPDPDAQRARARDVVGGELPSPLDPPSGCRFRTRCPHAIERCARELPSLRRVENAFVACHRAEELANMRA